MAWKKLDNGEVTYLVTSNEFQNLSANEKELILQSNPFSLLNETFSMLDKGYINSNTYLVKEGIQRLEGLLQLDFINSNQLKIRSLLSLHFVYWMYKNSSSGRFSTYADWDNFSSHCQNNFSTVSKFKGKTVNSPFDIIKLSINSASLGKEYAEMKGWYSDNDRHYFEDDGILDYLSKVEAIDNKKNSTSIGSVAVFVIFAALLILAFFLPTFSFNSNTVSGFSALQNIDVFFNFDKFSSLAYWHFLVGNLIALTYALYALNLLYKISKPKKKVFYIFSGIILYGSLFLFGYEWYQSGSFTSFFHKAGIGFYLGTIGIALYEGFWGIMDE